MAIGLKRAAHFGRAPVVHDLRIANMIFGLLDPTPPADLVSLRENHFPQISSGHHYAERRSVVDLVSVDVLSLSTDAVEQFYETDWRKNLNL
jgi:hypothetical protein